MRPLTLAFLVLTASLTAPALAQTPHTHDHGFHNADQWARYFDDPARDAWQKPHEVIQALKLKPDAKVADLGAGTGYFAMRLAHMTPKGTVFAVDVEPDMVKYLAERAKRDGMANVRVVQATPADPRLPEKVDRVLLVNVYHHIGDRTAYFRKLREYLNPGAQVAIIDFRKDSPVGPPPGSRIAEQQVIAEMKDAGYTLAATNTFLPNQFYLVFGAR